MRSMLNTLLILATLSAAPLRAVPDLPEGAPLSEDPQTVEPARPSTPPPADPPPPPAARPTPPTDAAPPTQRKPADRDGQWVHTEQYGWVWMPYGEAYTYRPDDDSTPSMYVYYPDNGWCWVLAPWLWGLGPMPYFGVLGPAYYGWYGYGWGRWYGFHRAYWGWGWHGPAYWGGGRWHGVARYGGGPVREFRGGFHGGGFRGGAFRSGGFRGGW
ncbi:MAG TPA: hypothetical protein VJ549_05645, partial [Geothrix sp.]|nr:hypothetical protein [Geothrix sp.]